MASYINIPIYIYFTIVTYCFLYPIVYNLSHAHNVHSWGPGLMGRWRPGLVGRWGPGLMGRWRPGLLSHWRPGLLGRWRPGLLGRWRPGLLGRWRPSDAEIELLVIPRSVGERLLDGLFVLPREVGRFQ